MRCPSCGTDNTPDSRFCGGCGAKTSTSRVAPTVKLSDDATFPTTIPPAPYAAPKSIPPTNAGRTPIHLPTPPPGTVGYGGIPSSNPGRGPGWIEPANAGERGPTFPPTDPSRFPATTPGQPAGGRSPASIPPTNASMASPRAAATRSSPSLSMAAVPQRRSSTVIAVVVILDLGLAGAGAMLLAKGLGGPTAPHKPTATAPVPAATSLEAPKPPTGASAFVASSAASATTPGIAEPEGDVAAVQAANGSASATVGRKNTGGALAAASTSATSSTELDARKDKKHHAKAAAAKPKLDLKAGGAGSDGNVNIEPPDGPLDPYVVPRSSVGAAVDAKAAGASGVFFLCHHNAGQVHGTVNIAFQVLPDGHVAHVSAVENTTGSDKLASCLGNTIASWTFPPHTGEPAEFVRPFKYD